MKEMYVSPELEIETFDTADFLNGSPNYDGTVEGPADDLGNMGF